MFCGSHSETNTVSKTVNYLDCVSATLHLKFCPLGCSTKGRHVDNFKDIFIRFKENSVTMLEGLSLIQKNLSPNVGPHCRAAVNEAELGQQFKLVKFQAPISTA